MIKIMITKPKKTPDHLVMIIQLMNIFMTCKDWFLVLASLKAWQCRRKQAEGAQGQAVKERGSLGMEWVWGQLTSENLMPRSPLH